MFVLNLLGESFVANRSGCFQPRCVTLLEGLANTRGSTVVDNDVTMLAHSRRKDSCVLEGRSLVDCLWLQSAKGRPWL